MDAYLSMRPTPHEKNFSLFFCTTKCNKRKMNNNYKQTLAVTEKTMQVKKIHEHEKHEANYMMIPQTKRKTIK